MNNAVLQQKVLEKKLRLHTENNEERIHRKLERKKNTKKANFLVDCSEKLSIIEQYFYFKSALDLVYEGNRMFS